MIGGALIGLTMAIRNRTKAWTIAVLVGTAVGGAYSVLLEKLAWEDRPIIGVCILLSGALGGVLLGVLLQLIRARWKWWSRWD